MAGNRSSSRSSRVKPRLTVRSPLWFTLAVALAGCHGSQPDARPLGHATGSRYLFVWAGDADKQQSDFVAVVDVDPQSRTYADVLTTLPVGAVGTMAHHTEYEMPADGIL